MVKNRNDLTYASGVLEQSLMNLYWGSFAIRYSSYRGPAIHGDNYHMVDKLLNGRKCIASRSSDLLWKDGKCSTKRETRTWRMRYLHSSLAKVVVPLKDSFFPITKQSIERNKNNHQILLPLLSPTQHFGDRSMWVWWPRFKSTPDRVYQILVPNKRSLLTSKPKQAFINPSRAFLCLLSELTTSVPGLTRGALSM